MLRAQACQLFFELVNTALGRVHRVFCARRELVALLLENGSRCFQCCNLRESLGLLYSDRVGLCLEISESSLDSESLEKYQPPAYKEVESMVLTSFRRRASRLFWATYAVMTHWYDATSRSVKSGRAMCSCRYMVNILTIHQGCILTRLGCILVSNALRALSAITSRKLVTRPRTNMSPRLMSCVEA